MLWVREGPDFPPVAPKPPLLSLSRMALVLGPARWHPGEKQVLNRPVPEGQRGEPLAEGPECLPPLRSLLTSHSGRS